MLSNCDVGKDLRVPGAARRSNQLILKEIFIGRTDAEALILLATWYEESIHWKRIWCWERLKAGGEGDNRGWDGWMRWSSTQWTCLSKLQEIVKDGEGPRAAVHRVAKSQTRLSNWTTRCVYVLVHRCGYVYNSVCFFFTHMCVLYICVCVCVKKEHTLLNILALWPEHLNFLSLKNIYAYIYTYI